MASFVDAFPVASLPRVNDLGVDKKVVVAHLNPLDDSIIDVGISKSNISSYIVKPSPRLLWSYPISPLSVIDALEVTEEDVNKKYVFAVTERKAYKLVILVRNKDEIISKQEIDLPEPAAGLKVGADNIYIVSKTGVLRCAHFNGNEWTLAKFKLTSASGAQVIHFSFQKDLLVLLLEKKNKNVYKLIALNNENSVEVKSHTEDHSLSIFKALGNHIYKYDTVSRVLHKIRINDFAAEKAVALDTLMTTESSAPVSMSVAAPDRILITDNDNIYLINVKFETLLARFPLDSNSHNYIHKVMEVKGSTKNSLDTFLLFVKLNLKKNTSKLALVNFNVGMNTLAENLGKGLVKQEQPLRELPSLYDNDASTDNLEKIYSNVERYWNSKDLKHFEAELLNYFKQKSRSKVSYEVYDIEKDAIVNVKFIEKVLGLIFRQENGKLHFVNDAKVPQHVLTYFLTHKLFPIYYTKGLLELLVPHSRLLRQAIITCPNIPLRDLLVQVIQVDNKEILIDLIARIVSDFSVVDVTIEFKNIFNSDSKIDFDYLLKELIKIDNSDSWVLIQSIIDIIGFFSLNEDLISKMIQLVNMKIEALTLNSYNSILLKQSRNDKTVKKIKVPVYSIEKLEI